jgi:hypothetical protein
LSGFNEHRIKYLIICDYAVMHYLEPRYTKVLDLWIVADRENAAAVFKALRRFGAPLAGMSEDDFAHEGFYYQIGMPPVRVDIFMSIKGSSFEEAWGRRVTADLGGVTADFISKPDLIAAKMASGRPQDLVDAQLLAPARSRSPTSQRSRPKK